MKKTLTPKAFQRFLVNRENRILRNVSIDDDKISFTYLGEVSLPPHTFEKKTVLRGFAWQAPTSASNKLLMVDLFHSESDSTILKQGDSVIVRKTVRKLKKASSVIVRNGNFEVTNGDFVETTEDRESQIHDPEYRATLAADPTPENIMELNSIYL